MCLPKEASSRGAHSLSGATAAALSTTTTTAHIQNQRLCRTCVCTALLQVLCCAQSVVGARVREENSRVSMATLRGLFVEEEDDARHPDAGLALRYERPKEAQVAGEEDRGALGDAGKAGPGGSVEGGTSAGVENASSTAVILFSAVGHPFQRDPASGSFRKASATPCGLVVLCNAPADEASVIIYDAHKNRICTFVLDANLRYSMASEKFARIGPDWCFQMATADMVKGLLSCFVVVQGLCFQKLGKVESLCAATLTVPPSSATQVSKERAVKLRCTLWDLPEENSKIVLPLSSVDPLFSITETLSVSSLLSSGGEMKFMSRVKPHLVGLRQGQLALYCFFNQASDSWVLLEIEVLDVRSSEPGLGAAKGLDVKSSDADDEMQRGAGDEMQRGAGDEMQRGAGDEMQRGAGDEMQRGTGDEMQRGTGDEMQRGTGDEMQRGAGDEMQRGTGDEMQHGSNSGQPHLVKRRSTPDSLERPPFARDQAPSVSGATLVTISAKLDAILGKLGERSVSRGGASNSGIVDAVQALAEENDALTEQVQSLKEDLAKKDEALERMDGASSSGGLSVAEKQELLEKCAESTRQQLEAQEKVLSLLKECESLREELRAGSARGRIDRKAVQRAMHGVFELVSSDIGDEDNFTGEQVKHVVRSSLKKLLKRLPPGEPA